VLSACKVEAERCVFACRLAPSICSTIVWQSRNGSAAAHLGLGARKEASDTGSDCRYLNSNESAVGLHPASIQQHFLLYGVSSSHPLSVFTKQRRWHNSSNPHACVPALLHSPASCRMCKPHAKSRHKPATSTPVFRGRRSGEGEEASGWKTQVCLWCLNPALAFWEVKEKASSVVLTSGTLAPLESFASEVRLHACARVIPGPPGVLCLRGAPPCLCSRDCVRVGP